VKWLFSWPLGCLLYYTVPNCVLPRWERWFMVTFVASTLWIAVFSYLMVWMVRSALRRSLSLQRHHVEMFVCLKICNMVC